MKKGSLLGCCALLAAGCVSTESGNPEVAEDLGSPNATSVPDAVGPSPGCVGPTASSPGPTGPDSTPIVSPSSVAPGVSPGPQGSTPGATPEPPCEFAVGVDGGASAADGGAGERVYRCTQGDSGITCGCGDTVPDDALVPIPSGTACTDALQAQCGFVP